jgi:predicted PurR-regulated permease PerM
MSVSRPIALPSRNAEDGCGKRIQKKRLMQSATKKLSSLLVGFALVIVVVCLYLTREFMVPVALAGLLAFLLAPIDKALQRLGLARTLSVGLVTLISISLIIIIAWGIAGQIKEFAEQLPTYKGNIKKRVEDLQWDGKGTALGKARATVEEVIGEVSTNIPSKKSASSPVPVTVQTGKTQTLLSMISPVLGTMFNVLLVIVLVVFMLLEREELRVRVICSMGEKRKSEAAKALDEAGRLVGRYLVTQSIVNACVATTIGVALFLLNVPYALLWGFTIFILRFIPYIGIWIAGTLPLVVSLATSSNWTQPLEVVGVFVVFEPLVGMVLEPVLFGRTIGISKLAMLISIAFWTWLWGPVGLLLATPLTACLAVIAKYIPELKFIAVLLSDKPVT